MRNKFDEQLDLLNVELIKMGAMCENAIATATKAIFEDSDSHKLTVFDDEIDRKEKEIETMCLRLLLKQQPVAQDLRTISSALKMISDMERIGDQASDIAEIAGLLDDDSFAGDIHLKDMAKATIKMVTDAIDSFVKRDIKLANRVISNDDIVDELFTKTREELIGLIAENPLKGEVFLDYLMIAKYFERIGDHAVNIADWVIYSISGEHT